MRPVILKASSVLANFTALSALYPSNVSEATMPFRPQGGFGTAPRNSGAHLRVKTQHQ